MADKYYESDGTNLGSAGLARYDGSTFTSLVDDSTYTPQAASADDHD